MIVGAVGEVNAHNLPGLIARGAPRKVRTLFFFKNTKKYLLNDRAVPILLRAGGETRWATEWLASAKGITE